MFRKYSYDYEWDKEYCYSDSHVLINRLGITDNESLSAAEREITSLKLAMAIRKPIIGNFDLRHLQKIHKYIFGDVYAWAGNLRHVNIAKGNPFCLAQNLEQYAGSIFGKLEREHYLINVSDDIPYRLAYYLSEINVLHPFREGNGRTQRLFIMYLANIAGYVVDFSEVTPEEMIISSAESFACEYDKINAMFERITAPIAKEEQIKHIQYFFGRNSPALQWLL
ncbi:MAG: Fic family protein [Clostridia bacterium]|nr:Fic family protein [Clostridia bacterium]